MLVDLFLSSSMKSLDYGGNEMQLGRFLDRMVAEANARVVTHLPKLTLTIKDTPAGFPLRYLPRLSNLTHLTMRFQHPLYPDVDESALLHAVKRNGSLHDVVLVRIKGKQPLLQPEKLRASCTRNKVAATLLRDALAESSAATTARSLVPRLLVVIQQPTLLTFNRVATALSSWRRQDTDGAEPRRRGTKRKSSDDTM